MTDPAPDAMAECEYCRPRMRTHPREMHSRLRALESDLAAARDDAERHWLAAVDFKTLAEKAEADLMEYKGGEAQALRLADSLQIRLAEAERLLQLAIEDAADHERLGRTEWDMDALEFLSRNSAGRDSGDSTPGKPLAAKAPVPDAVAAANPGGVEIGEPGQAEKYQAMARKRRPSAENQECGT